jgi:hypothetical protein
LYGLSFSFDFRFRENSTIFLLKSHILGYIRLKIGKLAEIKYLKINPFGF